MLRFALGIFLIALAAALVIAIGKLVWWLVPILLVVAGLLLAVCRAGCGVFMIACAAALGILLGKLVF